MAENTGISMAERKLQATAELIARPGHPLETFDRENQELKKVIEEFRTRIAAAGSEPVQGEDRSNQPTEGERPVAGEQPVAGERPVAGEKTCSSLSALLDRLLEVGIHYAKKGDLLYPVLKVRYQISGPSDLLWTEDDDILDELKATVKELKTAGTAGSFIGLNADRGKENTAAENTAAENAIAAVAVAESASAESLARLAKVLQRLELMIVKENRVTFPNCAMNFTEEEWMGIYRDSKDYDICFGVVSKVWEAAENYKDRKDAQADMEVVMPGGSINPVQLAALLNTIPMEITFIDEKNINRFFNEGPKIFKRPVMALGREMFSCHPPKFEAMARRIVDEFRAGTLDEVPIWSENKGRTILTTYRAVRDKDGTYLGTVELVQDMEAAKEYFVKKPVVPVEE